MGAGGDGSSAWAPGIVLARGLVRLVTRTINDLYFVVAVRELAVSPWLLAKGAGLGGRATLLAALAPALEATGTPPGLATARVSLEERARAGRAAGGPGRPGCAGRGRPCPGPAHPGAGGRLRRALRGDAGAALLAPGAVVRGPAGRGALGAVAGVPGRLAAGVSCAALADRGGGGGADGGRGGDRRRGLMVGQLPEHGVRWLETSLVADVYVSAPTLFAGSRPSRPGPGGGGAAPGCRAWRAAGTYRGVRVASAVGPIQLVAVGQLRLPAVRRA